MIEIITLTEALKHIQNHQSNVGRYRRLFSYYNNNTDIKNRKSRPNGAVTNRLSHNYASIITNQTTGYFISRNIDYICPDNSSYAMLARILKENDEPSHNLNIATDMSIYGKAYELLYIDEQAKLNMAKLDPKNVMVVYSNTIKPYITDAIVIDSYNIDTNKTAYYITIYDDSTIRKYEAIVNTTGKNFLYTNETNYIEIYNMPHNLGMCPIVEYMNRSYLQGDFESVIDQIDAYDLINSLSLDDAEDFTNAYLVLSGMGAIDTELMEQIRTARLLSLDEQGKAEWLIKNVNSEFVESLKSRLNRDIHKFSSTVDMSDPTLYNGTISGIAIKFKFQALEQLRAEKEKNFRIGLMKRIDIISNYLSKLGYSIDKYDIDMRFSANLPVNNQEEVATAVAVSGIVSRKTQLSILPFVDDVENELSLLEKE